ncbi:MAG: preprotein translocase subunit SecG [Phycisphaerae bacterium]|nr:preprotein translocase subunit SecG [Phycisphaerae bacterium]
MAILAPLTVLFIFASLALVLMILVQRPQGGGLAGAFGGAGGGGTETAFGGRTGDVLTVATVGAFLVYLALAIVLNVFDKSLLAPPAPEQPAAEAAVADPSAAPTTDATTPVATPATTPATTTP